MSKNLDSITMRSGAMEDSSRPLNLGLTSHRVLHPQLNMESMQSVAGVSTAPNYTEGNRNFCSKHKKKLVNFCLDHGVPLCAYCFKDHQGHRFEMLENYAQAEVSKVHQLVDHLEKSIKLVKEKLELRRNLNEKKGIAARQFFDLTRAEMERIEREFWVKFQREQDEELELF
jgi:hypothetical protein